MTGHVLVLRGEPAASATARLARELGLSATCAPMSDVQSVAWHAPDRGNYDAVLLGSANAVRWAGAELGGCLGAPALVVGDATARAAADAGFEVAIVGKGGLQSVLDGLGGSAPYRRLLRLAGADHIALTPPPGVMLETRTVYEVLYQPLSDAAPQAVDAGAIVLLHSGLAAQHFASEIDRLGIKRSSITLAALASRVARAAGAGWQRLETAGQPNDRALLELARDMCQ